MFSCLIFCCFFFSLLLLVLTFEISIVGIFQVLREKRRLHYKFCFLLLSKYFGGLSFGVSWIKKSAFLLPVSLTEKLDTVKNILSFLMMIITLMIIFNVIIII